MLPPSIFDLLSNPSARHALLAPVPLVLGLTAVLPCLFMSLVAYRRRSLALLAIAFLLLGATSALAAALTRDAAVERIELSAPPLTPVEQFALDRFERLMVGAPIWFLIPIPLLVLSMLRAKGPRIASGVLGTIGTLCITGWAIVALQSWTAVVFLHGLGVPERIPESTLDLTPAQEAASPVELPAPTEEAEPAGPSAIDTAAPDAAGGG